LTKKNKKKTNFCIEKQNPDRWMLICLLGKIVDEEEPLEYLLSQFLQKYPEKCVMKAVGYPFGFLGHNFHLRSFPCRVSALCSRTTPNHIENNSSLASSAMTTPSSRNTIFHT